MSNLANEVTQNLKSLIGLKLSRVALAADMRTLQFGDSRVRVGGGVVGQYALHLQCPWRLEGDTGLVTGSDDLYVAYEKSDEAADTFDWEKGGSLQERILRDLLNGYDATTKQIVNSTNLLVVEALQADTSGGFSLTLSGGYKLSVFPDGTRREAWRFFKPSRDNEPIEPHFVVPKGSD